MKEEQIEFPKGNIAKYYIYLEIKNKIIKSNNKLVIVDMGCGNGSQFDWLYNDSDLKSKVNYYGFDIDKVAIEKAKKLKPDWTFYNEPAYKMENHVVNADIITSLSALEHVYKRIDFLSSAQKILKKDGGVFYLNYDNGHFLTDNVREKIKNILGPFLVKFGYENWYQSFVWQKEIYEYLEKLDFQIMKEYNFSQATNKGFHKAIDSEVLLDYMKMWLDYELKINHLIQSSEKSLEKANSNKFLLSKLFELKK